MERVRGAALCFLSVHQRRLGLRGHIMHCIYALQYCKVTVELNQICKTAQELSQFFKFSRGLYSNFQIFTRVSCETLKFQNCNIFRYNFQEELFQNCQICKFATWLTQIFRESSVDIAKLQQSRVNSSERVLSTLQNCSRVGSNFQIFT